jgi:hypothetical protein
VKTTERRERESVIEGRNNNQREACEHLWTMDHKVAVPGPWMSRQDENRNRGAAHHPHGAEASDLLYATTEV